MFSGQSVTLSFLNDAASAQASCVAYVTEQTSSSGLCPAPAPVLIPPEVEEFLEE